jgi:hypothetical protein
MSDLSYTVRKTHECHKPISFFFADINSEEANLRNVPGGIDGGVDEEVKSNTKRSRR